MVYVYSRAVNTPSKREDFCGVYASWTDAIERIMLLYACDKASGNRGEFYYFAKEH